MLSSAVMALLLACGGGETAEKTAAPPPPPPEVVAPAKEEPVMEEAKAEAGGEQIEKISRTFKVPVAEKATIKTRAKMEIVEQAKRAGFDRATDIDTKEVCDERVCTVTVTANAVKAAPAAAAEGADNAENPCAGGEEAGEDAENPCGAEGGE